MTHPTPERWRQIDALFAAALERDPHARRAWVEASAGDDGELRDAVLALLRAAGEAEAALGESVSGFADPRLGDLRGEPEPGEAEGLPAGARVGPYRVLREIGRGGMGTVYLAERADDEFRRQVALKLVKRGMDTDEVLRRFRYERQILASLEHPHIARLYDGGAAADGRPYLVMEHVPGQPVTRWCDARDLSLDARLRLFAAVCGAVHFAHRNFVVHRDIKPSNILVTEDGTPRLLDFGIARLLDPQAPDESTRTRPELRLLTPEYAAPEQLRGAPVTTASDVYALGVVLHELLTGRRPERPGERASEAAARPPAPGDGDAAPPAGIAARRGTTPERLGRRLRGDLDTIVARALAEAPERRYPSADALRADVQRHLDGVPVAAQGDSAAYRAAKFVRRHRAGVLAAALVGLSLLGGTGAALWQGARAARERDAAREQRARAEAVSSFLLGMFESADPMRSGAADTLRVRGIIDRGAERVRRDLAGQPELRAEMLLTLARVYTSLGLPTAADGLLDDALRAVGPAPRDGGRRRAALLVARAGVRDDLGDYAAADTLYRAVIGMYEGHGWAPDDVYLSSLSERGGSLERLGRMDEAEAHRLRALRLLEADSLRWPQQRAAAVNNLGSHFAARGDHARAEPLLRRSLALERALIGPDHPRLAVGLNNLASAVHYQGRHGEAEPLYREAIAIARRNFGDTHPHVAQFTENLATLHDDRGAPAAAEPLYREALRIRVATLGRESPQTAVLQRNLALNRHDAGELGEAEALLREAAATLRATVGGDHLYTALAEASLGRTLAAGGRAGEALPLLRGSLEVLEQQLPDGHWRLHHARSWLAAARAARGERAAAEPVLLASHAALLAERGERDGATRDARENLYRLYAGWGRPREAERYRPAGTR